ncbi:hypothetical protein IFO70_28895 [Phormidium tenue FACHB-886]|nr:hypothetical protein [Phormidium tenue FACHB-886]
MLCQFHDRVVNPARCAAGGKVLRFHTAKTKNRATLAFRQAAAALQHFYNALSQVY